MTESDTKYTRKHESNIGGWKDGAADVALSIARELGFPAYLSKHLPTVKGGDSYPIIVIENGSTSLTSFWDKLEEKVPKYWEKNQE